MVLKKKPRLAGTAIRRIRPGIGSRVMSTGFVVPPVRYITLFVYFTPAPGRVGALARWRVAALPVSRSFRILIHTMNLIKQIGGLWSGRRGSLGLALGGGAARGIAHIGVIKVLQEEEIPICCVAGTSIGSVVGAFYCAGKSWREMWEITQSISWGELVRPTFSGMGLVKTERLEKLLVEHLGEITFDDLQVPLTTVAVDIMTAEPVLFRSGSVARAARASASIPGIFEPIETEAGQFLVDGGVSDNLPSRVVREMGASAVLAVDLNRESSDGKTPRNLLDVTFRTFAVLMWNTSREGREDADLLLAPDIDHIGFHDLGKAEELFAAGEESARRALPQIRKLAV
ncbi:MAG: hypothetical protein EA427_01340 [Spirochaetaceae bacterium]|nr:MAG: hypothetical protein EA427_01340 [Spirochaetaceae bacterium]